MTARRSCQAGVAVHSGQKPYEHSAHEHMRHVRAEREREREIGTCGEGHIPEKYCPVMSSA